MIEIHTRVEPPESVNISALENTVRQTFELTHTAGPSGISLYLTDDSELQSLNKEHLGIDTPTDVLSFPIPFEDPESGEKYLGDIMISVPTAARQAESGGHALEDEIRLLIVHGILHLLGYDHTTSKEKEAMWEIQTHILKTLEIHARPTES